MLDLTSVTRADSTLENSRSNLHCLRGLEITLVFDYVVEASREVDYVVVEASREANIMYITTEEPLWLFSQASKQSTLALITCPYLLRFVSLLIGPPILTDHCRSRH